MSIGTPAVGDVPGLFDVIINGKGYCLYRAIDTSLPFRTQRAKYSRTPTFLERTNVSGAYGDNEQDFFLTWAQKDWSGGDGQIYSHVSNPDSLNRFYYATGVDITVPGQVRMSTVAAATTSYTEAQSGVAQHPTSKSLIVSLGVTRVNTVDANHTVTNKVNHGLGAAPSSSAITSDDKYVYCSTTAAGTVGVRAWDSVANTMATFSATPVDALAFLPSANTLYGAKLAGPEVGVFSTAGVYTTLFTWKNAQGTAYGTGTPTGIQLKAFGNKLVIMITTVKTTYIYQYDGSSTTLINEMPPGFHGGDIASGFGSILFVSGISQGPAGGVPTVYALSGGSVTLVWQFPYYLGSPPASQNVSAICGYGKGLLISTYEAIGAGGVLIYYDLSTGATSVVADHANYGSNADGGNFMVASGDATVLYTNGSSGVVWGSGGNVNSSSYIYLSQTDFDSNLTKVFRSVKVDFRPGAGGDGGSIDIAYAADDIGPTATYTTITTGATSGTEYAFPSGPISGRTVSLRIKFNLGTSSIGPRLKRVYTRASPVLQSYRNCEYILDCSGVNGRTPVILNDNETPHPLDGQTMATNLNTDIASITPFTITDCFGSYTGIIEPGASEIIEVSPKEYIARIATREI